MEVQKIIDEIVTRQYPKKNAPKWVNYELFKEEKCKELMELIEGNRCDLYEFSITLLASYMGNSVDPGSSGIDQYLADQGSFDFEKIEKFVKKHEDDDNDDEDKNE